MTKRKLKRWTKEELEKLGRLYPDTPNTELAEIFGVTECSVYGQAAKHGFRKSKEYIARNHFKPGLIPRNKGKKIDEWMSKEGKERLLAGVRRKRRSPSSALPPYSDIKGARGYVLIKLPGRRKYVSKMRYLYEKHHGPIPKGYVVYFIDGDRNNFDISNLGIISKEENMRRNSLWNKYPDDVAHLVHLKGILKKQINKSTTNDKKE